MSNFDRSYWDALSEILNSNNRQERMDAVETLASHDEIQAIRLLLKALGDLSSAVRVRIQEVLLEKSHPAVVSGLIAMLDSEKFHVRSAAGEVLKNMPSERTYPQVCKLIEDQSLDRALRIELIPVLARSNDAALSEKFRGFLQGDDSAVRKAAIEGISHSDTNWSLPLLINALDSKDRHFRSRATAGLIRRKNPETIKYLVDLVKTPGLKGQAAVEILSRMEDKSVLDMIRGSINDNSAEVRDRVLVLTNALAPADLPDVALKLLGDRVKSNRSHAIQMLEVKPAKMVVELIGPVFPGDSPLFAESCAILLSRINSEKVIPFLKRGMESPEPAIRKAVITGAGSSKTDIAVQFLADFSMDKDVALQIAKILSDMGSPSAVNVLLSFLENPDIASMVSGELLKIPGDRLTEALQGILQEDEVSDKTRLAIEFIGRQGDEAGKDSLAVIPDSHSYAKQRDLAVREIEFRSELKRRGWDPTGRTLQEIESVGIREGWKRDLGNLRELFSNSLKIRIIRDEETELREKLKRAEKQHKYFDPKIERMKALISVRQNFLKLKAIYAVFFIIGVLGTLISLLCNFKFGDSYWYPLLVLSVFIAGCGGFLLNKHKRSKVKKLKVSDPDREYATLMSKKNEAKLLMEPIKKELAEKTAELESLNAAAIQQSLVNLENVLLK